MIRSPVAQPAQAAERPWLWALLGAAATGAIGLAGWWFLRRREPDEDEAELVEVAPIVPQPAPAPRPPAPLPRPTAPVPEPAPLAPIPPPQIDPIDLALQPLAVHFAEREIMLDLEMLIGNPGGTSADGVRVAAAVISASADQDAQIAAFAASAQLGSLADPFDLIAGGGGRMPLRLALPREAINMVTVGGRPMFVPIVLINVRWRGGLSIRRFAASFMVGTGGQGDKLGPIWLDRPAPAGPLAATRYVPRELVGG
ncbi:MAG: hypothetical protein EOP59_06325 [Sphingomonadales bacterium]|nr:MAG: hypothetical protein EOP59_06325 [Sphingomonadales bacterium]